VSSPVAALLDNAAMRRLVRRPGAYRCADPYAGERLGDLRPDRARTVNTDDGVPLAVTEVDPADGGRPELAVVLLHGFAVSARCWHFQRDPLAELVAPRVRSIYYDHRDHGRSGRGAPDTARISVLARDLRAVLDARAPHGPLVLAGHSMGGMTIMELARLFPGFFADRVAGVALLSTSAGHVGAHGLPRPLLSRYNPLTRGLGLLAHAQPRLVELVRAAGGELTRRAVRELGFGSADVASSVVDFVMDMLAVTPVSVLTEFIQTLGHHNRIAALAGLRWCECLVLAGTSDRLIPFSHSERIAAELPDAQLHPVGGAGHSVMLECPDEVSAALTGLVAACAVAARDRSTC
jgi:pimeloyl-ACP methyl ester carboxylesterase